MVEDEVFMEHGGIGGEAFIQGLLQHILEEDIEFGQNLLQGLSGHSCALLLLPTLVHDDGADGLHDAFPQKAILA